MDVDAITRGLHSPGLLTRIFALVSSSPRDVLKMSHVTSVWRAIALHAPQLWTTITPELGVEALLCFLTRSRDAPLDVHFMLPVVVNDPHERIRAFMEPVLENVRRWRSFSVDVPLARWMDVVLDACHERLKGHVLDLDALSLCVNSNALYGYMSVDDMHTPALPFAPRHLVLDSVPAWHPTLFSPRLRVLDIKNHHPLTGVGSVRAQKGTLALDMHNFLALLQGSPALESIQILSSAPTLSGATLPTVSLPLLHTLAIESTDALALAALLERASAPALTTLDIKWVGKVQTDSVEPFLASLPIIAPQLQSLAVTTVAHIPTETWVALFSGLKALRYVALEAMDFGDEVLAALAQLPELRGLAFRHHDTINGGGLLALLHARIARQDVVPLEVLEVSWCESVYPEDVQALTEHVPHLVARFSPASEPTIDETMEEMDLDDDGGEEDEDGGDDDSSDMDDDDDDLDWESDVRAELELLREDNRMYVDMIRHA